MSETLILIKSHAHSHAAKILAMADVVGLEIIERIDGCMDSRAIADFYSEHAGRPYFGNLVRSVSGPVVAARARIRLGSFPNGPFATRAAGFEAPLRWRLVLGATDPTKAEEGTVRASFGNKEPGKMHENAAHGSDGPRSAARELALLMNPVSWMT